MREAMVMPDTPDPTDSSTQVGVGTGANGSTAFTRATAPLPAWRKASPAVGTGALLATGYITGGSLPLLIFLGICFVVGIVMTVYLFANTKK